MWSFFSVDTPSRRWFTVLGSSSAVKVLKCHKRLQKRAMGFQNTEFLAQGIREHVPIKIGGERWEESRWVG